MLLRHFLQENPVTRNCLVYYLLLWFTTSVVVTNSQGFSYNPPPLISFPIQIFVVIFISKILPLIVSGPLQILQTFTAVFLTIPTVALTFSNASNIEFRYRIMGLILVLLNQVLICFFQGNKIWLFVENRKLSLSIRSIAFFLSGIVFVVFIVTLASGVLDLSFVTLGEIYTKRSELKMILSEPDLRFLGYLLGWLGGITVPIIFYFGIKIRNWLILAISLLFFLGSYVLTAQKWIIASGALILILHLISSSARGSVILTKSIFQAFNWLIVALISLQSIFPKYSIADLGVRRSLLDPSIMLQYYVKFAGNYPPQWWADSKISRYFLKEDPIPVSTIIGERYFNVPSTFFYPKGGSTNATGGTIADAIAQGGVIGFFFISLLLIGVFYVLQILSSGRDRSITFVLCGFILEMLVEGTFHTLLLSRGLILIFVVFLLLPKVTNLEAKSKQTG